MKRFSKEHVLQSAREFASSRSARVWHWFGSEIQEALLDQHVMNEIRAADRAESQKEFTATENCDWPFLIYAAAKLYDIATGGGS